MTDFTVFTNCNFFAVSLDLEGRGMGTGDSLGKLLEFFAKTAKKRLKAYIQGIAGQDVADRVRKSDAFAMDGPYLGADSEHLQLPD